MCFLLLLWFCVLGNAKYDYRRGHVILLVLAVFFLSLFPIAIAPFVDGFLFVVEQLLNDAFDR